jgi:hypothetical protein
MVPPKDGFVVFLETSKNSKHILQGFVKISNHNFQGSLWKFLKAFNHISQG